MRGSTAYRRGPEAGGHTRGRGTEGLGGAESGWVESARRTSCLERAGAGPMSQGTRAQTGQWSGAAAGQGEGRGAIKAGGAARWVLAGGRTCAPFEGGHPPLVDGGWRGRCPHGGWGMEGGGAQKPAGGGLPVGPHCARVGRLSRRSQVLLLPLPRPAPAMLHTRGGA